MSNNRNYAGRTLNLDAINKTATYDIDGTQIYNLPPLPDKYHKYKIKTIENGKEKTIEKIFNDNLSFSINPQTTRLQEVNLGLAFTGLYRAQDWGSDDIYQFSQIENVSSIDTTHLLLLDKDGAAETQQESSIDLNQRFAVPNYNINSETNTSGVNGYINWTLSKSNKKHNNDFLATNIKDGPFSNFVENPIFSESYTYPAFSMLLKQIAANSFFNPFERPESRLFDAPQYFSALPLENRERIGLIYDNQTKILELRAYRYVATADVELTSTTTDLDTNIKNFEGKHIYSYRIKLKDSTIILYNTTPSGSPMSGPLPFTGSTSSTEMRGFKDFKQDGTKISGENRSPTYDGVTNIIKLDLNQPLGTNTISYFVFSFVKFSYYSDNIDIPYIPYTDKNNILSQDDYIAKPTTVPYASRKGLIKGEAVGPTEEAKAEDLSTYEYYQVPSVDEFVYTGSFPESYKALPGTVIITHDTLNNLVHTSSAGDYHLFEPHGIGQPLYTYTKKISMDKPLKSVDSQNSYTVSSGLSLHLVDNTGPEAGNENTTKTKVHYRSFGTNTNINVVNFINPTDQFCDGSNYPGMSAAYPPRSYYMYVVPGNLNRDQAGHEALFSLYDKVPLHNIYGGKTQGFDGRKTGDNNLNDLELYDRASVYIGYDVSDKIHGSVFFKDIASFKVELPSVIENSLKILSFPPQIVSSLYCGSGILSNYTMDAVEVRADDNCPIGPKKSFGTYSYKYADDTIGQPSIQFDQKPMLPQVRAYNIDGRGAGAIAILADHEDNVILQSISFSKGGTFIQFDPTRTEKIHIQLNHPINLQHIYICAESFNPSTRTSEGFVQSELEYSQNDLMGGIDVNEREGDITSGSIIALGGDSNAGTITIS